MICVGTICARHQEGREGRMCAIQNRESHASIVILLDMAGLLLQSFISPDMFVRLGAI